MSMDERTRTRLAARIQQVLLDQTLRAEWGKLCAQALAEILRTPVRKLVDRAKLGAALDAVLSRESVEQWSLPMARALAVLGTTRLQNRAEPIERFVPPSARQNLEALVGLPEILPPSLVQELAQDPAIEALLQDVLFEALKQFSNKVNPFTAEWGLPALMKHLPPFGFGALKSGFDARKAEFEDRMEPEIRKFVQGFSRKGVQRLAELMVRKQKEPELVALRVRVLGLLLARPLGELSPGPDDPRAKLAIDAGAEILGQALGDALLRSELDEIIDAALSRHGDSTLSAMLDELGMSPPAPAVLAEACWPIAEIALGTEAVRHAIEHAIAEALAEEPSDGSADGNKELGAKD